MDRWIDGLMDGYIDGIMDGWTDGMDGLCIKTPNCDPSRLQTPSQ